MSAQLAPVFQAPRPPKGEHEITLCPDWANDEPVVCHYEYVRGQRQTFDDPGYPECWNLVSAYIRAGTAIECLVLSRSQKLKNSLRSEHESHDQGIHQLQKGWLVRGE